MQECTNARTQECTNARMFEHWSTNAASGHSCIPAFVHSCIEMIRPTVARVDLGAITRNFRRITEHLARERPDRPPRAIAVIKANAYGHGAGQVGRALEDAGADLLACADIEEGAALRAAGVRAAGVPGCAGRVAGVWG